VKPVLLADASICALTIKISLWFAKMGQAEILFNLPARHRPSHGSPINERFAATPGGLEES
jgi:hypothetical protein